MRILRVISAHDHAIILGQDEITAGLLFTAHSTKVMETKAFQPFMLPELKARLTLVLKQIDKELVKENQEKIKEEIERILPETKTDQVFIMKINILLRFSDQNTAVPFQNLYQTGRENQRGSPTSYSA